MNDILRFFCFLEQWIFDVGNFDFKKISFHMKQVKFIYI